MPVRQAIRPDLRTRPAAGPRAAADDHVAPAVAYIPNPLIIPVGMVMGVLLAMPFGPVNLLGIQRAVERGFFGGMAAGLGIMLGDGLIALGAALGVNAISGAIREYRTAIQILGGLALLGAGIKLYLTPATVTTESRRPRRRRCGTTSGTFRRRSSSPSPTPARCWG